MAGDLLKIESGSKSSVDIRSYIQRKPESFKITSEDSMFLRVDIHATNYEDLLNLIDDINIQAGLSNLKWWGQSKIEENISTEAFIIFEW